MDIGVANQINCLKYAQGARGNHIQGGVKEDSNVSTNRKYQQRF